MCWVLYLSCRGPGPEPSPKPSTSPPSSLGSPGRRPPKSPSEHKERKPSLSDDKKKVVCGLWPLVASAPLTWQSDKTLKDVVHQPTTTGALFNSTGFLLKFFSFFTVHLFVLAAPRRIQRLQLLLGGPLQGSEHSEENRCWFLRHRFQGQVARRRCHQNLKGHWTHTGAAAGLQEWDAGLTVRATLQY